MQFRIEIGKSKNIPQSLSSTGIPSSMKHLIPFLLKRISKLRNMSSHIWHWRSWSLGLWRNTWRCRSWSLWWWGFGQLSFALRFHGSTYCVFDTCAFGLWRIHNWFECFGRWNDVIWWYEMGVRVGFEKNLISEHFCNWFGRGFKKGFWNETVEFWKTEPFRALKDKGIRIFEKRIRIAYWKFWNFRLFAKGFESSKEGFKSLEDNWATGKWIRILEIEIRIT